MSVTSATSPTPADPDTDRSDSPTRPASPGVSAFYVMYVGLFVLLFAYLATVRLLESRLQTVFQTRVERAIMVTLFDRPVSYQIEERVEAAVRDSLWVRWGGVRVTTLVLARDGVTWLYVDGHGDPVAPDGLAVTDLLSEWINYLPAQAEVSVTLPHQALLSNLILVSYASVLLLVVYLTHRRVTRFESQRLAEAMASRREASRRASEIESELALMRTRLAEIEPTDREQSEEIGQLQTERERLQRSLTELARREEALRSRADRAVDLAEEVRALEDLLEEATVDLDQKNDEIVRLEQSLKKANRSAGTNSPRARSSRTRIAEQIARRFRTLYKTIEIDDRAIDDIAGLGDDSLRLKAEESVKRLADDADNVAVRRKVGGLPDYVQVYELGFAGKGRIYYTRGRTRRFRVLLVGAKNTQPTDLEYLSRLPRDEFV